MHEGVQAEIHQVSKFDKSSVASRRYLGNVNMTREDVLGHKSLQTASLLLWTKLQDTARWRCNKHI